MASLANLLKLCIHVAVQAALNLRVDLGTQTDRYSLALLYAILDHGRSILALIKAREYAAIPIVCRSAVEAYVDIVNLCDHTDYWLYLEAADTKEWSKFLNAAIRGDNPILAPLAKDPSFRDGRRNYARLAQQLGKLKIKKLQVKERFKKAGMTGEYESIYALLCAEAHSNVANLQSRYYDSGGERLSIRRRDIEYPEQHHYEGPCTANVSEIILRSTEKMLRHCGHGVAVLSEANALFNRIVAQGG